MAESLNKLILIVDDEEYLRDFIATDFQRKGYQTLKAANGREAFELIQTRGIDLVLSDIRMPGGDGIELLNNSKAYNTEMPVVMLMTGFADLTLEEAYDQGADAVFEKPFNRKRLFETVERALLMQASKWGKRPEGVDFELKVELHYGSLSAAVDAGALSLGRGGMFVSFAGPLPETESQVAFQIVLGNPAPKLEGTGIVRWVRSGQGAARRGCGLEFSYLEQDCLKDVLEFMQERQFKSFIPQK